MYVQYVERLTAMVVTLMVVHIGTLTVKIARIKNA